MVPRLIVIAIAINISFEICLILVDISNVAGWSINALFTSLGGDLTDPASSAEGVSKWNEVIGPLLIGGLVGATAIPLVLAGSVLPFTLLALLLVVLILIARQAIIILLIVISPLAFAAYLLPNTEQFFKKWKDMFVALLMVFPVVGLVFGASNLASSLLIEGDGASATQRVIGLAVLALPLFAVPMILKGALGAMGQVGARLQGAANNAQGRASKAASQSARSSVVGQRLKYGAERRSRNKALSQGGMATGSGPMHWKNNARARAMRGINRSRVSGDFGDRLAATGAAVEDKDWDDTVGIHKKLYSREQTSHDQLIGDMNNKSLSAEKRAAAAGMLMASGNHESQSRAIEQVMNMTQDADDRGAVSAIQKQMAGDSNGKPLGLSHGAMEQLQRGGLGYDEVNGIKQESGLGSDYSYSADFAARAAGKVSAAGIPSMDPGDLGRLTEMATDPNSSKGSLSDAQLGQIKSNIQTAYNDPRINPQIDDKARAQFDKILAQPYKDSNYQPPVSNTASSSAPSSGATPPSQPPAPPSAGSSQPKPPTPPTQGGGSVRAPDGTSFTQNNSGLYIPRDPK